MRNLMLERGEDPLQLSALSLGYLVMDADCVLWTECSMTSCTFADFPLLLSQSRTYRQR